MRRQSAGSFQENPMNTSIRRWTVGATAVSAALLAGCVAVPGAYYGADGTVVQPGPVVVAPPVSVGIGVGGYYGPRGYYGGRRYYGGPRYYGRPGYYGPRY